MSPSAQLTSEQLK
jgi:hypothetical protein